MAKTDDLRALRERNYELAQKAAKTSEAMQERKAAQGSRRRLSHSEVEKIAAGLESSDASGIKPGPRETKSRPSVPGHNKPKVGNSRPVEDSQSGQPHNEGAGNKPKVGRPRLEDRNKTLAARKPWADLGMSESTWRRRLAEKAKKNG